MTQRSWTILFIRVRLALNRVGCRAPSVSGAMTTPGSLNCIIAAPFEECPRQAPWDGEFSQARLSMLDNVQHTHTSFRAIERISAEVQHFRFWVLYLCRSTRMLLTNGKHISHRRVH